MAQPHKALVTGAASGIGVAIARHFLAEGYAVLLLISTPTGLVCRNPVRRIRWQSPGSEQCFRLRVYKLSAVNYLRLQVEYSSTGKDGSCAARI